MKKGILTVLFVFLLSHLLGVTVDAQQRRRPQPGATQGGPTTGREMMPAFDMRYFLGEWEIEWSRPDTPLGPGGKVSGRETVSFVEQGRILKIEMEGEGPDGPLSWRGILLFNSGPYGQFLTRYTVDSEGLELLKPGAIGGDLGGYYSHFWETPPFEYNDATVVLRGRSYLVSPAAYRVNQQISVDDGEFVNFGVMWFTKEIDPPPSAGRSR